MGLSEFRPKYFEVHDLDDVAVVRFSVSHINDEENIEELGHELFAIVEQFGMRRVVLNLTGVEYFTSSVVGKIITLHRKLHRSDGLMCLSNLTPGIHEVLNASRLLNYFTHAPTEVEAIEKVRTSVTAGSSVAG